MSNPYDTVGAEGGPQRKRHGSPTFYNFLHEMAEIHDVKSHDYASDSDPFANYEFAGHMAIMFKHSAIDAGFSGRLAEKLYRLYILESTGKIPKNESVADTERDIAVIATLWMAARRDKKKHEELEQAFGAKNAVAGENVWNKEAAPPENQERAAYSAVDVYLADIKKMLSYNQQYEIFTNLGQYLLGTEKVPRPSSR
jgi:hypothetical protein